MPYKPKLCDRCGLPYYRRNIYEGWNKQHPGSRTGWGKAAYRICTHCQTAEQTEKVLRQLQFTVMPRKGGKPKPTRAKVTNLRHESAS